MVTVLVVDDSAVDRTLIAGLLGKQADWELEFATNGQEALTRLEKSSPDLVLTDLQMPEMDGLALVKAMHRKYPAIPVVLLTGCGSEEIAVNALRQGAASYVPKRMVKQDLLDIVTGVLVTSRKQRENAAMIQRMSNCSFQFCIENDFGMMSALNAFLQQHAEQIGFCGASERVRIGIALDEAFSNAIYHGNLEVSSELREQNSNEYYELAQRRMQQEPYRDRQVYVSASYSQDTARFVIRDEGPGFDQESLPDPTDPANLSKPSGRGILLMKTFMDRVEFNAIGNEVTLVKQSSSESDNTDDS